MATIGEPFSEIFILQFLSYCFMEECIEAGCSRPATKNWKGERSVLIILIFIVNKKKNIEEYVVNRYYFR